MNKIYPFLFLIFTVIPIFGQNPDGTYNPQVISAKITPEPLFPVEASGEGTLSFIVGNTGSDPLEVFTDQYILLTITLLRGVPSTANPIDAISGDYSGRFTWTYDAGTYTGTQTQSIGAGSSGTIEIAYRVTSDSKSDKPENGFRVNLTPAPYETGSNIPDDDAASALTWTEIRDFGDAPVTYGVADHIIDFKRFMGSIIDGETANQPSADASADDTNGDDDEDGVTFNSLIRGRSSTITIRVADSGQINAWIDWNIDGDFSDDGEHIITNVSLNNGTHNISIDIPDYAVITDPTFARFRLGPRDLTPTGSANSGEVEDYRIQILCDVPAAPSIGTKTDPTCSTPTGSVVLNGLPSGSWTLIRNPGSAESSGSGTTHTVSGLTEGTYTFSVRTAVGCTSDPSANVVIGATPSIPGAPLVGEIIQPDCDTETGSVSLSGLPSGSWTINPGSLTGTGSTTVIAGLAPGTHNFTVTASGDCTSPESDDIVINLRPSAPARPVQSIDCALGFGRALITVTSPLGTGLQYRLNAGAYQNEPSFAGVDNGTYTITVRNAAGCIATGPEFVVACACFSPPTVTLSSQSGSVCGTDTPVTVSGNVFGGSVTTVNISENGSGSVTPSSTSTTPFSFTYTPGAGDAGRTVTITLTSDNPLGFPCQQATTTYTLSVSSHPQAPIAEAITHPTCIVTTGSVVFSRLPSSGSWTITRNPGAVELTGTGTSTTIAGLLTGTYTFSVANSSGCSSLEQTQVIINPPPPLLSAPVIGDITHPTCNTSTGSVALSGLPATGLWSLLRNPGGVTITGSGSSRVISGIPAGSYTFTVTNSVGCISSVSSPALIHEQPNIPVPPVTGNVTQPGCTVPTGSIILGSLPATGTWTLTRYPGTIVTTGSGATVTVNNLGPGTYNFTVTNAEGCTSALSSNILIQNQPVTPEPPVIGTITQPTCTVTSASVNVTGLPSRGNWTLTLSPGEVKINGIGSNTSVPGLLPGTYNLTVTSSEGCTSPPSANFVIIPNPEAPVVVITQPDPVCSPSTIDLTSSSITAGSTAGITFTYWSDPASTISYNTPAQAQAGTYYIKGTTSVGCSDIKPVTVNIRMRPSANAGVSQVLEFRFETNLNANTPGEGETGTWSVFRGSGQIDNEHDPLTSVSALAIGKNIFVWVVTNEVCSPTIDSMTVDVHDITIPSLITPNNDGNNDYLIIRGIEEQGKTELTIFDRSGVMVYENKDYDNKWNGVDYNENPLPDDTYFYLVKTKGRSRTGFIVLRK